MAGKLGKKVALDVTEAANLLVKGAVFTHVDLGSVTVEDRLGNQVMLHYEGRSRWWGLNGAASMIVEGKMRAVPMAEAAHLIEEELGRITLPLQDDPPSEFSELSLYLAREGERFSAAYATALQRLRNSVSFPADKYFAVWHTVVEANGKYVISIKGKRLATKAEQRKERAAQSKKVAERKRRQAACLQALQGHDLSLNALEHLERLLDEVGKGGPGEHS